MLGSIEALWYVKLYSISCPCLFVSSCFLFSKLYPSVPPSSAFHPLILTFGIPPVFILSYYSWYFLFLCPSVKESLTHTLYGGPGDKVVITSQAFCFGIIAGLPSLGATVTLPLPHPGHYNLASHPAAMVPDCLCYTSGWLTKPMRFKALLPLKY